jgi:hypothetical protein
MEVMAIESPWLRKLIYGSRSSSALHVAAPFRADVAYGSIAGDSTAYLAFGPLSDISPYGSLHFFQQPSRFPFLEMERRAGAARGYSPIIGGKSDYSDGLVPLWSSMIPGSAHIVAATHDTYFANAETQQYLCRWLSDASLPTGKTLNARWNTSIASRDGRRRWEFQPGCMAPGGRSSLYACIDGVGRILPEALHTQKGLEIRRDGDNCAAVVWRVPGGGWVRRITLFEVAAASTASKRPRLKRIRSFGPEFDRRRDQIIVDGLQPNRRYVIAAEARIDNRPDPPITFSTGSVPIPDRL